MPKGCCAISISYRDNSADGRMQDPFEKELRWYTLSYAQTMRTGGSRVNIEHLNEFIELSRQLNFTAAAKTLHMTQPALSNHVHALEKETGVLLIERSAKDCARLTPAGQCFLDMAKKIIALHEETLPELQRLQQAIEGKITIRSPRHEYCFPLLNYVYEFQRSHPNIDIVIRPWIDIDGIEDVSSGKVDCAYLGYADYKDDKIKEAHGIEMVPYTKTELLLWVDKTHPLAKMDPLRIRDIDGYPLLIPANKKHDSWHACIENVITIYELDCSIDERYCDSLEDLALNKALEEDVLLLDASLLGFPPFQLRDDRVTRHFTPNIFGSISLCYRCKEGDPSMQLFADFLFGKHLESSDISS